MHMVVCGKVIPVTSVPAQIHPETRRMVRKDVGHELDPQASCALEEELRLMEKHNGTVTVVTMGPEDALVGIRTALAMGATAAVHLSDDALKELKRRKSAG